MYLLFENFTAFIVHFLKDSALELDRIFYNSLSYPFFATLRLEQPGDDILFWQEPIYDEIPGNMQMILGGSAPRTRKIMVMNQSVYEKALQLTQNNAYFEQLGYVYQPQREAKFGHHAVVFTASDQLEQIDALLDALPEMHFHIAALTEMSAKLMKYSHYDNVTLYPNITYSNIEKVWEKATYYLDINHYNEVSGALRQAFDSQVLIVSFEQTRHFPSYQSNQTVFTSDDVQEMVRLLKMTMADRELMQTLLQKQLQANNATTVAMYQEKLV